MGISDSGQWLSRCFVAGVPAGLVAALWSMLSSGLRGLPWWSGLALYRMRLWGLNGPPVIAHSLAAAVTAGCVWLVVSGLLFGSLFGLVGGVLLPRSDGTAVTLLGAIGGLLLLWAADGLGLGLVPPTAHPLVHWSAWVAMALIGGTVAAIAHRPD